MNKVYFIVTECLRYVKIGFSRDPEKRWAQLQVGNPLNSRILGTLPGGRICETLLHMQFEDLRANGEWFELRGSLLAYLEMKGLFEPTYSECDPETLRDAQVVRAAGWDTLTDADLDEILVEPASAWCVYYGDCGRGIENSLS